jgi:hypothetical protein
MSLSDLASLGSFVSAIAVLVSLVYLALQVRQGRQHTAAQISQARTYAGMQNQEMYILNAELPDLILRVARGGHDMSDADWIRFHFVVGNIFLMMEDEFRQYHAGMISAERHSGFVRRFSSGFRSPGYRAAWIMQRDGYEPDFQAYIDALVKQGRETSGSMPNWSLAYQAAVAAEIAGQSPRVPESALPTN